MFINAEKVGFENVIAKQMVAQYKLLITTGKCAPIDVRNQTCFYLNKMLKLIQNVTIYVHKKVYLGCQGIRETN